MTFIMKRKKHSDIKYDAAIEAIGWAYADCCVTLDKGDDPRNTLMPDVIKRAEKDLKLKNAT